MKMMSTSATTPDAYAEALSGWQRAYVVALRTAVRSAAPALREQLKWGHLVYLLNGPVLLLRAEPERVLFGFWRGRRLRGIEPRLKPGGKYEMATLALRPDTPLRRETVQALVQEAARLDRELGDPTAVGTVDAYIRAFPAEVQALLQSIRVAARAAAPQAAERLSYCMPSLFQHGVLLHYAAFKQHIGLFPPVTEPVLREKAARYAGPKGNLQLPLNELMPLALIGEIVRERLQANRARRGTPQGGG
jgi:uncharacterized protein YdhG (YjbR/CyaY superfamily)